MIQRCPGNLSREVPIEECPGAPEEFHSGGPESFGNLTAAAEIMRTVGRRNVPLLLPGSSHLVNDGDYASVPSE